MGSSASCSGAAATKTVVPGSRPENLDKNRCRDLFEQFASVSSDSSELCLNSKNVGRMAVFLRKKIKTSQSKRLIKRERGIDAYDDDFFSLIIFALDDDKDGKVVFSEWFSWLSHGARMDESDRLAWVKKDPRNQFFDLFLRSVILYCSSDEGAFQEWGGKFSQRQSGAFLTANGGE